MIERFVPGLKCILLHGLGRHAQYEDVPDADAADGKCAWKERRGLHTTSREWETDAGTRVDGLSECTRR